LTARRVLRRVVLFSRPRRPSSKKKPRRLLRPRYVRAAPLVKSGTVGAGGSWVLQAHLRLLYVRALGGDHLTDHRRGTHRLDHLPFSAWPIAGPRTTTTRRTPTPGSRLGHVAHGEIATGDDPGKPV